MKKVVCIADSWRIVEDGKIQDPLNYRPVKGEMYNVLEFADLSDYYMVEGFRSLYNKGLFRDVDNTFGHVVTETIEQQIELEKIFV
jgi:hypothetical protein